MARIWKHDFTLEALNASGRNTLMEHLDIELIDSGDDYLEARMPVDERTVQPMGILHGGASVVLAETLGSLASTLCIEDLSKQTAVGVEINANHLRSVPAGQVVIGRVSPIRVGRTIQVWQIDIRNAEGKAVCVSRLTIAIVPRRS